MDPANALLTIAEMAIGLAGFSAVVAAFTQQVALSNQDKYRFFWLFTISFIAAILAFIPIILSEAGSAGAELWQESSIAMIVVWLFQMSTWVIVRIRTRNDPSVGPPGFAQGPLLIVPSILNLALQVVNAWGGIWQPSGAAYIVGALIWLYAAALVFLSIVLERPNA